MRKFVFSTVLLCMVGLSPTIAQDTLHTHEGKRGHHHHHHHHHDPEAHLNRLKKALDLNDTQVAQIRAAFETHHQKMKSGKDLGDAERKTLRQSSKSEFDTQLKSILTDKQYSKYQKKIAKRKKHKHKNKKCRCE